MTCHSRLQIFVPHSASEVLALPETTLVLCFCDTQSANFLLGIAGPLSPSGP
jgi:hypothetical protein